MNYGTLEIELVDLLNAFFVTNGVDHLFEAIPIPQNQSEQERPFIKGTISVQYFKSDYQPSLNINQVAQAETVTLRFTFQTTNLRMTDGFYNLLDFTKKCLLGYKPTDAVTRLVIDVYDLLFYEMNTFQPYLQMKADFINVQVLDDSEQSVGRFVHATVSQGDEGINADSFNNDENNDFNGFTYNANEI